MGFNISKSTENMAQNVLLVWLDSHIKQDQVEYKKNITSLRKIIDTIYIYTNVDDCMQFVEQTKNENVCMIVSGSLGQHIVPRIHNLSQLDSIFIFCGNKQYHEQWAKNWSKIKGVYTHIGSLCHHLKQSAEDCEQNAVTSFSLVSTNIDASSMNLDQLDPMFICTQIIKEILLGIKFEQKDILDFTRYCRKIFETHSEQVKTFENDYRQRQIPIRWYTTESFLYPMLNRALRLLNIDVIIKMGFFISDLHREIDELFTDTANSQEIFTVYRGQGIFKDEFQKICHTKGGLIAFNNFLFANTVENVSMGFAQRALANPDMIGVLFTMKIDTQQSTTPFALIQDQDKQILFTMHTVFRIRDIKQIEHETKRLFRVELELAGDKNDQYLHILTKRIREETFPNSDGWNRLGEVLLALGKPKQAEEVYQSLLQQEADESKHGWIYNQLGKCKHEQEEYKEAIRFFKKSIAIQQQIDPLNHSSLASTYTNIGNTYYKMNASAKALKYYENALEINQQSLSPIHPSLASSYNNIGMVYNMMNNYSKALSFYEKALVIQQQSLPPNHPDLAMSYNNIGLIYENMKDYTNAYSYCEKAVMIGEQSLSSNHQNLEIFRKNYDRVKNSC